jgi:hypothetical protein
MKVATKRSSCFLLIFLVASTLPLIPTATATAKPSTPQFTVRYINDSYDYTTSPSTDPYTGATIPPVSYHVDHSYIQVSFENNKLPTPPADSHSEYYYNIRYKGQYTDKWIEARTASDGYYRASYFKTVNFTLSAFSVTGQQAPNGTKIDFQVQLMYGCIGKNISEGPLAPLFFVGETSGWSNTKTVTVGDTSFTPVDTSNPAQTPTIEPTQTPTVTPTTTPTAYFPQSEIQDAENVFLLGLDWDKIVIIALVIMVTALVIVVFWQRKKGGRTVKS